MLDRFLWLTTASADSCSPVTRAREKLLIDGLTALDLYGRVYVSSSEREDVSMVGRTLYRWTAAYQS